MHLARVSKFIMEPFSKFMYLTLSPLLLMHSSADFTFSRCFQILLWRHRRAAVSLVELKSESCHPWRQQFSEQVTGTSKYSNLQGSVMQCMTFTYATSQETMLFSASPGSLVRRERLRETLVYLI